MNTTRTRATGQSFPDTLRLAKERIRISDIAARYLPGWKASKSCRSPFREDRKASFSVFDDGRAFHDFATGDGGDVVRFLELATGMDAKSAIREIVAMAGLSYREPLPTMPKKRPERPQKPRGTPALPEDLHEGSDAELSALARLRGINPEACQIASERGLLRFTCELVDGAETVPGWIILDGGRRNAQARRLDGRRIAHIGAKAKTVAGSDASWPIGARTCQAFDLVAFCEGGPDLLAALHFAWCEGVEDRVGVTTMLGAGLNIADDALPCFAGKHVRLFPHGDEPGKASAIRWARALRSAGATVDAFSFDGIRQANGAPVCDLNDLAHVHADDFENDRALWNLFGLEAAL